MRYYALLLLICAAGCQPMSSRLSLTSNHLSNASILVDSVRNDLKDKEAVTSPVLTSSVMRLSTAHDELSAAQKDQINQNAAQAKQADELVKAQTQLTAYHDRWLGDKFFRLLKTILLSALAYVVVSIGLSVWGMVGTGGAAAVAGRIGGIALHGLPWLGAILNRLFTK